MDEIKVQPPQKDKEPPTVEEGESLESINTGSLFKTEETVEIDDKKPFKLNSQRYIVQALIIIAVLAALFILSAVLLFKTELEQAAILYWY